MSIDRRLNWKVVATPEGLHAGLAIAITHVVYGLQDATLCDTVLAVKAVVVFGREVTCRTCKDKLETIRKQKYAAALVAMSERHVDTITAALYPPRPLHLDTWVPNKAVAEHPWMGTVAEMHIIALHLDREGHEPGLTAALGDVSNRLKDYIHRSTTKKDVPK